MSQLTNDLDLDGILRMAIICVDDDLVFVDIGYSKVQVVGPLAGPKSQPG